jgi:hypothetical protein
MPNLFRHLFSIKIIVFIRRSNNEKEDNPVIAEYTAIVKQQGDWWIGWIEEVPGVNCQELSREELLKSLRVTLHEAIEFNRQDAKDSAGTEYEEESIAVSA